MTTEMLKRFIIGLVAALVIVAVILVADDTRPKKKPDDIRLNERGECVYPMSLSFAVVLVQLAFILGVIAHYTFQNGCCWKRRDDVSGSSFVLGIFLAIISWSLTLDAGRFYLMDMAAIRPGNRGKAPECYTYLQADHHLFIKNACNLSLFAIIFGALSSKLLSPPPIAS